MKIKKLVKQILVLVVIFVLGNVLLACGQEWEEELENGDWGRIDYYGKVNCINKILKNQKCFVYVDTYLNFNNEGEIYFDSRARVIFIFNDKLFENNKKRIIQACCRSSKYKTAEEALWSVLFLVIDFSPEKLKEIGVKIITGKDSLKAI